ncbi:VCBS repeat-containing protein [Paracnuella aquatica]|uniref:VCBS repeat-containing protein n=1 Tax=Paracnuella aquatica TaxID=2268757 RepID=UPI000DEEDC67|nr:VCBS repeat-containing protein [Paracnuella aquatica]RPD51073.1 hypothetical protein DRJ53_06175 [Paracnuella aquatica]
MKLTVMKQAGSWVAVALWVLLAGGCSKPPAQTALFEVLQSSRTGLHHSNNLKPTAAVNMFTYMYFYNGAGVGAGDFNNDGLTDLFFASNQGANQLYLNKGNLSFETATAAAAIPDRGGWSTGVSVADVNGDGLLDIYVCQVGAFESLEGANQLLICQGIKNGVPVYKDEAAERGVAFSGFSTQAAFFDFDLDGDLDLYLLNHAVHQRGNFAERKAFAGTYHPQTGDRFYRNDGGHFTDITRESGINSTAIGYGLGIAVSDINLDGYPDLYIGNDFHENDYLYINTGKGSFTDEGARQMGHTSQFSMGVDVADADNDGFPEIMSVDMLPADPYILKRSLGDDEYAIFQMKQAYGYQPQYARNALQWNRGNGAFSEVAQYGGVAATDWSWAPLWMDFDNDGLKDLFVSNGIPRRLNDIDYVAYVSGGQMQTSISSGAVGQNDFAAIDAFPQIKLPNKFFRNGGNLQFKDAAGAIAGDKPTFSNGAVYADLDNDGDLDIVVNNIDEEVLVYQNKTNDAAATPFLRLKLEGPKGNTKAVGAKLLVYADGGIRTYEHIGVRGFQSSMEVPLHVGLHQTTVDSMLLIWPDNSYQRLQWKAGINELRVQHKQGLPRFDYTRLHKNDNAATIDFQNITAASGLEYRHKENAFVEFDREPLMPHMVSREGPAMAVADINGDGLDDVFLGAAAGSTAAILVQTKGGRFVARDQPALQADSLAEDVDAVWADVNGDGAKDLIVASGGNEYRGEHALRQPRLYTNDGRGNLQRQHDAFAGIYLTASCVVAHDFTGDGAVDLFIGARAEPMAYGQPPRSYLLQNDGTGRFSDRTAALAPGLQNVGMVGGAAWADVDGDGDEDLVLALQWGPVQAFINNSGRFSAKSLTNGNGWWQFVLPVDVDRDGDLDLIAGNLGQNHRLRATADQPVQLYCHDFDGNGIQEQVLTYFVAGREIPFASKMDLEKQIPLLRKQFLYAADFAKATLPDILGNAKLQAATRLKADYFSSAVLLNDGKGTFTTMPLPWQAQLSTYRTAAVTDFNGDNLPDIMLGGNFWEASVGIGRQDAAGGIFLINKGKGNFAAATPSLQIQGQVRRMAKLDVAGSDALLLARNNDSAMLLRRITPVKRVSN